MKTLGQIAYEGYQMKFNGTIGCWKCIPVYVRAAWEAAAQAVFKQVGMGPE